MSQGASKRCWSARIGRFLGIGLALLLSISPAFADWAEGLYALSESGPIVRTVDGRDIHLGEKLDYRVARVLVQSRSNDNQSYSISLERNGTFPLDYSKIALCAMGQCITFNSGGSDSGKFFSMGGQFKSEDAALSFAQLYGATVQKRAHPGYLLRTRLVAAKEAYSTDEPLPVTLEIRNVGTTPFTFEVGGRNRGERDNQFGFTASDGVTVVADTGSPLNFGGLSFNKTLQPGETFSKEVDLRKWFTFKKPGTYQITGTYLLSFFDPANKDWFVTWEDYAAAGFNIVIR